MFQTEPVVYLQSLGGEWLTTLMSWVTLLGYTEYQIPLVIVIALGFSLRKGILLIHMMNWNGVLTGFAKEYFALPRPPAVDSAVQHMGTGIANTSPFAGRGASGFWSLLDSDIVQHSRSTADASWGFPSGHVSSTTTVWGGICALFRFTPPRVVAVTLIVLMSLSRMYLGRHFLADVIGGLVLGGAVVGATWALCLRGGRRARYFEDDLPAGTWGIGRIALFAYLLLIPFVFLVVFPQYDADDAGTILRDRPCVCRVACNRASVGYGAHLASDDAHFGGVRHVCGASVACRSGHLGSESRRDSDRRVRRPEPFRPSCVCW